jgi:hypothetical protein
MFRRKPVAAAPGASGSDGGYVVTERILQLLRRKPAATAPGSDGATDGEKP